MVSPAPSPSATVVTLLSVLMSALFGGACALDVPKQAFLRGPSIGRLATPSDSGGRLPPLTPPDLDDEQQMLYDEIVGTRIKLVGKEALFDEQGGLRGPWMAEVTSPKLGKHLEQFASAVRYDNSLEPRLYEIAILVVGACWESQFEWFVHEKLARKAGVADEAFPLMKALEPGEKLLGILRPDEVAVYRLALELMMTTRVSARTYAETKEALGGVDQKMADLCMTIGCYVSVSQILNMFEVPLPQGAPLPFETVDMQVQPVFAEPTEGAGVEYNDEYFSKAFAASYADPGVVSAKLDQMNARFETQTEKQLEKMVLLETQTEKQVEQMVQLETQLEDRVSELASEMREIKALLLAQGSGRAP